MRTRMGVPTHHWVPGNMKEISPLSLWNMGLNPANHVLHLLCVAFKFYFRLLSRGMCSCAPETKEELWHCVSQLQAHGQFQFQSHPFFTCELAARYISHIPCLAGTFEDDDFPFRWDMLVYQMVLTQIFHKNAGRCTIHGSYIIFQYHPFSGASFRLLVSGRGRNVTWHPT